MWIHADNAYYDNKNKILRIITGNLAANFNSSVEIYK
jgi:hypothetical protein